MTMTYRHLLVPTDGSARSRRAIAMAVSLAAQPRVRRRIRLGALAALDAVAREADKAGVRHASMRTVAHAPWQAIVRAARTAHCDLIVMATHGRGGLAGLGSQTMKTVAHKIGRASCRERG